MMEGITPVMDVNGNNSGNGSFWGGAGPAFGGALIGSWFANGWNGNGWGNNRNGGVGVDTIADGVQNLQSSINGLGLQILQGQNAANLAMSQGFCGTQADINTGTAALNNHLAQGFAGLNTVITNGDAAVQQTLCQGFGSLNTAIISGSKDNALATCQSTGAITSAISECCCSTQRLIQQESCATRELIKDIQCQQTRDQLCQARDEISALKSQNFTSAAIATLGNQLRGELSTAVNQIITHVRSFVPVTSAA